jgi:hypothetical protein
MRRVLFNVAKATTVAAAAAVITFLLSYAVFGYAFGYYWNYQPSDAQGGLGPFVTLLYSTIAAFVVGIAFSILALVKFNSSRSAN